LNGDYEQGTKDLKSDDIILPLLVVFALGVQNHPQVTIWFTTSTAPIQIPYAPPRLMTRLKRFIRTQNASRNMRVGIAKENAEMTSCRVVSLPASEYEKRNARVVMIGAVCKHAAIPGIHILGKQGHPDSDTTSINAFQEQGGTDPFPVVCETIKNKITRKREIPTQTPYYNS
jgi:hypothetical protein